jgi:hypothetical protein
MPSADPEGMLEVLIGPAMKPSSDIVILSGGSVIE